MRQRIHLSQGCLPRLLVVAAAAASVAGCAFFTPYVGMPKAKPAEGWNLGPVPFAGDANLAIAQVEAVRQDYLSSMQQIGVTRAAFATGSTIITGYALYNALKPNPPGTTDPTFETKRTTVALGAVLATSLGLSEYALNKGQESAYNVGYQALTCLLRQSAPLLMPLSPQAGAAQADNVLALEAAMAKLANEIDALELFVASARTRVAEGQALVVQREADAVAALIAANAALPDKPADKSGKAKKAAEAPQPPTKLSPEELSAAIGKLKAALPRGIESRPYLPRTIRDAEKALGYARRTLADGKKLLEAVAGSGAEIRERAHTIISTVNGLIRVAQPDLKAADVSLAHAQDIVSGFKKIGTDTAEDQTETSNGGSNTSSLPAAFDAPQFATAAPRVSPRWAMLGGGGVSMMGSSLGAVMAAQAIAVQQAAPATAASAPADAASGVKPAPAPAHKPAATKSPAPAPAKLTTDELEKLQGLIDSTLKQAKQRQADEAREKLIEGYKSKLEALAKPREVCRVDGMPQRCDTEALALRVEDLHAARRPVAAAVLHFRAQTKAVRRVAGCPSDSGLRVIPNESIVVQAGETYSFVVTQPNPGSPVAMLQGALGDELASLTTTSLGTAGMQAKVQFGKKAKGRYALQATDSTGEFSESVQIFVKAAPPEEKKKDDAVDKPKPAASAAGDS